MATSTSLNLEVGGAVEDEDMISDAGQDFHNELHDEHFQIQEDLDMLEEASSQLGYDHVGGQGYSRDDEFMGDSPTIQFSTLPEDLGTDINVTSADATAVAPTYDDQSDLYDWEDEIEYKSLGQPVYPDNSTNASSNPTFNQTSIDRSPVETPAQDSSTYENAVPPSHDHKDNSAENSDSEVDTPEQYFPPVNPTENHLDPPDENDHEDAWPSPVGSHSPPAVSLQDLDAEVAANQTPAHEDDEKALPVVEDQQAQEDTGSNTNVTEQDNSHDALGLGNVGALDTDKYQADENDDVQQENPYEFDLLLEELSGQPLHLHLVPTIIVNYEDDQFPLFPPIKGYPELQEYENWGPLLNDTQLAYKPLLDLLCEMRYTLGNVRPDYELVLKFPDFNNVEVRENDPLFSEHSGFGYDFYSMHVISSIFQRMHRNDGATELRPLFVELSARAIQRHPGMILKTFFEAARAGLGFSFNDHSLFEAINDGNNIAGTEQGDSHELVNINEFDGTEKHNQEAPLTDDAKHLAFAESQHEYDEAEQEEVSGDDLTFDHPDIDASDYPPEMDDNNTTGETLVDHEAEVDEPHAAVKGSDWQPGVVSVDQDVHGQPENTVDETNIFDQDASSNIRSQTYNETGGDPFNDHGNSATGFADIAGVTEHEKLEAGDSSLDTISNASSTVHDDSRIDNLDATFHHANTEVNELVAGSQYYDNEPGQEQEGNINSQSELEAQIAQTGGPALATTDEDELAAPQETDAASLAKVAKNAVDVTGPTILEGEDGASHLNTGTSQNEKKDDMSQTGLTPDDVLDYELTWGEERDGPSDEPFADNHTYEPNPEFDTIQEAKTVAPTGAQETTSPDTATTPNKLKRRHSDVEDNPDNDDEDENEKKRLRKTPEPELDEIV